MNALRVSAALHERGVHISSCDEFAAQTEKKSEKKRKRSGADVNARAKARKMSIGAMGNTELSRLWNTKNNWESLGKLRARQDTVL